MQIFLQILAVLGIILLSLIGIALLLIALVLFVPIRYKVRAVKEAELEADVRITWLLHLLSVKYLYPKPGEIVLRIFGIKAWKMKPGEEVKEEQEEPVKEEQIQKEQVKKEQVQEEQAKEEQIQEKQAKEEQLQAKTVKSTVQSQTGQSDEKQKTTDIPLEEEKIGFFHRIQYKIKSICDKIKLLFEKIKKIASDYAYYRDLLQKKENRLLFERCKVRILKVLKSIRPRVLKADLVVGTGSPDTTGYLLAVYGMLLPFFGNHINITPDFENTIFQGRVYLKGRITIFTILLNGAKIYFDKQLHQLIENLKRKDV